MLKQALLGGQVSQDGTVVFFFLSAVTASRKGKKKALLNNMHLVQLRRANI